nr:uncharacterized protein LOC109765811 [Aegilops tauschii subsp. strangulata]
MIGADFIHRRIAPLHNKGRPAWDFRNAADIMRLRPGLKHSFTVPKHAHFCQRLFQLKVDEAGGVERTGKAGKAGKSLFGLPTGVVPLSNNSCQTAIIAMMPVFNAHGLDPTWAEPQAELVQAFFDNLSERYVRDKPRLIHPTTEAELAYIAATAEEAGLAEEAGSFGIVEDEADAAAEEEFAEWTGSTREPSGGGAGAPLVEEVVEESAGEETEADDSSAPGRKRVLRQASSGEPVRPGGTTQPQQAQAQPMRQTRAAVAKKVAVAASSSSKRRRTPSPSPPLVDAAPVADFDLGSFNPKKKRRPAEEDDDMETLAQRAAKRAKASTGDKPPASTARTPVLVEISPDNSPRRSPRFSPQHEFIIHSSSAGVGARVLGANLAGFAGGERQQEEPLRAALGMPPPSTTPPRGASPARAPTAEPTRMEEEGADMGTDPPSTDQEDIDTVIEEVAKDAEAEAMKIAAVEAAKKPAGVTDEAVAGEAGKGPTE